MREWGEMKSLKLRLIQGNMKKWMLLTWCLLPLLVVAQTQNMKGYGNSSSSYFLSRFYYTWADSLMAKNGVVKTTQCRYVLKRSGKKTTQSQCRVVNYDSMGRVIAEWNEEKTERKIYKPTYYAYDKGGRLTRIQMHQKHNRIIEVNYVYNDSGKLVFYSEAKNSKVYRLTKNHYDGSTKLLSSYSYIKDTVNYTSFSKSFYEGDTGRLLRTESYDRNGKRIYSWDYTCNLYGDLSKSEKKKETRICTNDTKLPNGHRQMVYEYKTGDELRREILEYDSLNRLIKRINYAGKTGEKLLSLNDISYNSQGREVVYSFFDKKSGKLTNSYTYKYNQQGQIQYSLSNYFNKRQKLTGSWEMEYSYNGSLLARVKGMSLLRPGNESITEYSYSTLVSQ